MYVCPLCVFLTRFPYCVQSLSLSLSLYIYMCVYLSMQADQGTWQECQRLKAQLAEMQALLPPGVVETVQKEENTPRPTPVVPHEQSHVQPLTAQSQSDVDPGREEKSCRIL